MVTWVHQGSEISMTQTVGVLLPFPLNDVYSYSVPNGILVKKGDFVHIPWGKRSSWGVVWTLDPPLPPGKSLKSLEKVYEKVSLPEISHQFMAWVARYNLGPLGAVLKMVFPVPDVLTPTKTELLYGKGEAPEGRSTPLRLRVGDYLDQHGLASLDDLQKACDAQRAVLKDMVEKGWLVLVASRLPPPLFKDPDLSSSVVVLSPSQKEAATVLKEQVSHENFSVTLLEGVTGSGKTEVYFEAMRAVLRQKKQVLVLLPEIALTTQWLQRFEKNFGVTPALWHGDLRASQRTKAWRAIAKGQALVTVGARSALFLPYVDLGLIIVDEEHDGSYKQEEGFIYHARDMAVVRAQLGKIPLILASATPSLETLWNVQEGRYRHVMLEDRYQAKIPQIQAVDLRQEREKTKHWIAPLLRQHLQDTLARGEQSLLYLNRRGYAPLLLCRLCGERLSCTQCQAWLVVHHQANQIQCHHCGHQRPRPQGCQACDTPDSLIPCGPGVERIAEEVEALFPEARTAVMSRDTLSTAKKLEHLMEQIEAREIDILIGTQLVVKGHHFPYLTCVGVIDGDLSLNGGDPRACEKTYQLLHQVSGRAGRAAYPGHVFLQTYYPEHPVLQALLSGNRADFIREELQARAEHHLPPFGRLAALILSGPRGEHVQSYGYQLAKCIPRHEGVDVLGPAPAPLTLLRGQSRWRFLIKAPRTFALQNFLKTWIHQKPLPPQVRLQIDVDPYTFL